MAGQETLKNMNRSLHIIISLLLIVLTLGIVSCSWTCEDVTIAPEAGGSEVFVPTWHSSGEASVVPFLADKTGLLIVRAWIDGVAGRFLLDTGASATIISSELATRLGLGVREFSAETNIKQDLMMARVMSFEIGKETYRDFNVAVLDLSHFDRVTNAPVDGIIGVNLLKQSAFSIDIAGGCLCINISRLTGSQVPITVKNDRLYMDAVIDGIDSCFVVDSGANSTGVNDALWSIVSQGKTIQKQRVLRFDVNQGHGLNEDERIAVKLAIDSCQPVDIYVRHRGSESENLLGLNAMRSFVIAFDIAKGMSYWKPVGTHAKKTLNRSDGG